MYESRAWTCLQYQCSPFSGQSPLGIFLFVSILHEEARLATIFISVLDYPVVCFTNGMSSTGCPRSHFCSHRRTKRKEGSSTKEGTGEEGHRMITLACISSVLFAMPLYDKTSPVMPARLMLLVRSESSSHETISEPFRIDRYKYTRFSYMYNIRFAISTTPFFDQHPAH